MEQWVRVLKAADSAARWHSGQFRKGQAKEPYINHLLEVASLVTEATAGADPDLVIAALLHDAVEDQGVSEATITEMFSADVAALVMEVTDDKSLPKDERKRLQVVNAPHKSPRAAMLKLADKTSNLRAIAQSPPADWSASRRLDYVAWARQVVDPLRQHSTFLSACFDQAAAEAEQSVGPGTDE